ncbi:unnamed protein product [Owenia fusiformis]|uniref:Uncharacterized protein n=1 Tax=Owenia fusiformis TaxID=6347 RepID=A0A8J1TWF0_OWEFU|nr:unnamed protein product [Owenia fusiformis]
MNDLDENGWAHVHHASHRGFIKSIERFVKASEDQLELETGDDLHMTPFMLSVASGNLETVKCLLNLGAKINVINSQNHGVIEICALKQYIELLNFFIELDDPKLPVWKNLIRFLASDSDEEGESAGKCLRILTKLGADDEISPNWEKVYSNGIVPTIIKVIKGTIGDETILEAFHCLLNIISKEEVKEQVGSSGGMAHIVKLLKSSNNFVIQLAAETIKEMCKVKEYAIQASQAGAIGALVKVIQSITDPDVLVEAVEALGFIAEENENHQGSIGSTPGCVTSLINLYEDCNNKELLMGLTKAIDKIIKNNENNQTAFVDEGVGPHVIMLLKVKHKDLQLCAVDTLESMAHNNNHAQKAILQEGAVEPLMTLLKKSRAPGMQEKTANALWALAGSNIEERTVMAGMMGVQLLIEFLSSLSENLHYIGSEGLGVLAQGPKNKQTAIAHANGVHPLVRLLRSNKEYIVLSVIRTLRHLCVSIGYVPHPKNQQTLSQSRGIKFLVALMVHSQNELIQVESALTLGCAALGNSEILEEIQENVDFSYVRILKMMYSKDDMVRLFAGLSLATFAYNNQSQQKEIAAQGGVRFNCFLSFLQMEDEFFRCHAAFQVVVLARIIPDEEQAMSSAAGIKLLVDLLNVSKSELILALCADCIARLSHTRAGVPAAFVSIDTCNLLCNLMMSDSEQVRGCAAIALGYLSYNHVCERQLLNRCRQDPYLYKVIGYYTGKGKVSPSFLENWKHYRKIGLPPIEEGKPSLVTNKNVHYMTNPGGRPITILSFGETGASTNLHSSPFMSGSVQEDDSGTSGGHTSRSSKSTNPSTLHSSPRRSESSSTRKSSRHSMGGSEVLT